MQQRGKIKSNKSQALYATRPGFTAHIINIKTRHYLILFDYSCGYKCSKIIS